MPSDSPPHLLIVDDDARLRNLLARYLGKQGWLVTCAKDVKDAEKKLQYFLYDLIVLDVMMPGETGLEFARRYCSPDTPPILMLTAMGDADDRIAGLEAGVDDYLPKPFEPRELLLRIERILARTRIIVNDKDSALVSFGMYDLDSQSKRLLRDNDPVHLTESEMALLCMLAQHINEPVSRERLSEIIASPGEEPNPRSADVLITRLRKKIEEDSSRPVYLQTIRGEGYILRS